MGKVVNPRVFFRLKDFRLEHELKQSELAAIIGIQQCSISSYENKSKELSPSQYQALFDKYGETEVLKYRVTLETGATYNINKGGIIGNGNSGNNTSYRSSDVSKLLKQIDCLTKQNEKLQTALNKKDDIVANLQERLIILQDQVSKLIDKYIING